MEYQEFCPDLFSLALLDRTSTRPPRRPGSKYLATGMFTFESFEVRIQSLMKRTIPKNTICLWFDKDAESAARFYAATFPDSEVIAVHHAPSDYPSGKAGDVLTVEFT